jgi:predicted nucleotide-binding protein (sugar kinase/HSP70/actin superfamily)
MAGFRTQAVRRSRLRPGRSSKECRAIGLPRALFHYVYPQLWPVFFEALGFSVRLSGPTSRSLVERAGLLSETENCLPVKMLDAHLDSLSGRVDAVFVPRILSTQVGCLACPKLGALPDVAQAQFGARFEIVSAELDERRRPLRRTLIELGRSLGAGTSMAREASERALAAREQAWRAESAPENAGSPLFLLTGHPYNLYDSYFCGPVCRALETLGARAQRLDFGVAVAETGTLHWDVCGKVEQALRRADPARYAGAIHLASFPCGCDSIAERFYREAARAAGLPFMTLTLDEHSAATGLETRVEAFADSIGVLP